MSESADKWPDKEEGVAELVDSWRKYINDRPQLMSFLYDVDMLPEQIVSRRGAQSLDAVCCIYKAAENGQIPLNPEQNNAPETAETQAQSTSSALLPHHEGEGN